MTCASPGGIPVTHQVSVPKVLFGKGWFISAFAKDPSGEPGQVSRLRNDAGGFFPGALLA